LNLKIRGRSSLLILTFFLLSMEFTFLRAPCGAHNVGSGLVGQKLHLDLEEGRFKLDYTVEIPTSIWIREFQNAPSAAGTEAAGKEAEFTARLLQRLQRGLILLWNSREIPMERLQGSLEKSGLGDYNFFQYRLSLEASLEVLEEGTIILINRNYSGYQNVYSVSLSIGPGTRLEETNLSEPGQRFLLDAQTGLPWSMWEGLRSLRVKVRPAPFWESLVGGEEPLRMDLRDVYRKVSGKTDPGDGKDLSGDGTAGGSSEGRLKALLMQKEPDAGIMAMALLLAFLLGAIHAMSPGHGKALVGAYLVGSRGRPLDAVILGLIVTLAHVSSVLLLGVASLAASRYFVPEKMFPYIEMASALLLMALGAWMLKTRWPGKQSGHGHPHGPAHGHSHDPTHGHGHSHAPAHIPSRADPSSPAVKIRGGQEKTEGRDVRWKEMLSLGISGGMVPCPSALAILLIAIAIGKITFGIFIIIAFSLGLASILVAVGLLLVWTRTFLGPMGKEKPWIAWLPAGSSVVVFTVGLIMFGRALLQKGTFTG
jgi:ABC-type nickel/cobalt efflux system permease component RcnA